MCQIQWLEVAQAVWSPWLTLSPITALLVCVSTLFDHPLGVSSGTWSSGIQLLPMWRSLGKKKKRNQIKKKDKKRDVCSCCLLWTLSVASLEKHALWMFCLCLSNWQPFLLVEMSAPGSLLTVGLSLCVSLLARSQPGAKPLFHPPLCLLLGPCLDKHEFIEYEFSLFIYTRFFGETAWRQSVS